MQFTDLRSQVVKEASLTIACVARTVGRPFVPMSSQIVAAMLRVLKSNKGVMYGSANEALLEVVDSCHCAELCSMLCAASEDKHPSVREHVMRYLGLMLAMPQAAELCEATTDAIEAALRRTVIDASAPVRAEAKLTFLNYRTAFPVEAALLLSTLEPAMQKKLEAGAVAGAAAQQHQQHNAAGESVRDRILKARVHVAVVPLPNVLIESVDSAAQCGALQMATPPKSCAPESLPTPHLPAAQRAGFVHFIKPPQQTVCPQSTPTRPNEMSASSPLITLQQAAQSLRMDLAPLCPVSTPTLERMSTDNEATASPTALLENVAAALQVQFNESAENNNVDSSAAVSVPAPEQTEQQQQQVLLPVVTEEQPTFQSTKKERRANRLRAQKENGTAPTVAPAPGATKSKSSKSGGTKDSTPIAKRTRNRRGATVK